MNLLRYIEIFAIALPVFAGVSLPAFCAEEKISVYTVNDGLSQHSVTSIVQDNKNMLWIGTFDGLNMFDGVTFTNFRHYQGDSTSIIGNRILALANDASDGLWILFANNYIGKYCGNGKFSNYRLNDSIPDLGNEIKVMRVFDGHIVIEDSDSGVLFIRQDTLKVETGRMKALKAFVKREQDMGRRIVSVDFAEDAVWVSSSSGIFCSVNGGRFELVSEEYKGYRMKYARTGYVLLYRDNDFTACSAVRSESGKMILHTVSSCRLPSLVQDVSSGMNGEFWVASRDGLSKILNGQRIPYPPDSPVRTIFVDNYGVIWNGGLNGLESINPYSEPVYNHRFDESPFSLENHISTVNISDDDTEMWIGVMQRGLHLLEPEDSGTNGGVGGFRHVRHYFPNADVSSVCLYSADTVLVGTDDGLKMLVRRDRTFKEVNAGIENYQDGQPFRTLKVNDRMLFSNGNDLYSLTFRKNAPCVDSLPEINRQLPQSGTIVAMSSDPDGSSVWLGYRGASVYKVDFNRNSAWSLTELTGLDLPNLYIWDIFFDSRDRLWVGTDAGLNMVTRSDSTWCLFTLSVKDGLINDKIETIEEDSDGRIWAGTSQGIVCYDTETDNFVSYGFEDGFQSNNFTSSSDSFSDGTLVFGGIAGFSYFNPRAFTGVASPPSINVEKFTAGTRIVDMPENANIRIRNVDNNIKIKLSSYYSPDPKKIRYLYSINGTGWTEIQDSEIRLSGLSPGKYEISVKSAVDSQTTSPVKMLSFTIRRPLLLSIMAFVLYFSVLCSVAFIIVRAAMMRRILGDKLKMEESLRQTENRTNMEKLDFYTNIAHEIKTPLSLILGRIYDIENSGEASPNIIRKAKLIGDNAHIIKELTEQVLEFKRVESGKISCDLQRLDIMPYIRKVVDNYMDYADKRGVSLKLESSAAEIVCNIDLKKLLRIIYNLLSNAIKFSERGDSVEIKFIGKPDCLVLTVSDTGSGISEEDLPHIFERFYKSGKSGGSGIGLAFTKSLVELMGGRISVSSRIGEGSTFIVEIPDQKMAGESPQSMDISALPVLDNKVPVILLVEDNVELNEYITEILSVRFRILQAFDGKEAIGILQNRDVDLVITDIMMPHVGGIELAGKIKNIKQYSHIPIVFLSARTDPDDQLEGLQTGAVDYITKPFNPHILLMKIQNILSQYYLSKVNLASETAGMPDEAVPVRNKDEIFIGKAREIIYRSMSDEEFGVSALSAEMGISRVHLTREFQRIIGKSPSAFIKGIRLNHAKYLLSSGNYSIKEVLWEIGIRSHSGFTKIYKEEFGVLPSQTKDAEENESKDTDNEN